MPDPSKYLLPMERVAIKTRRHWAFLAGDTLQAIVLLIIGVLLMDACVQGAHVINQSVIYDLLPQARSRLTTVYITTMFAGGAVGSAVGAQAYEHWGWTGATLVAAAFPVLGLLFWLASRRHETAA